MAKIAAYVLLVCMLPGGTPVSQLCKIPVLIQHFEEHHNRNLNVGFMDFLEMHYWGNDDDDNDDDRDNQLPFKKETVVYSVSYHFTPCKFQVDRPLVYSTIVHFQVNEPVHLDEHPGSLFRPPQAIA